jgi:hypothetical protein
MTSLAAWDLLLTKDRAGVLGEENAVPRSGEVIQLYRVVALFFFAASRLRVRLKFQDERFIRT